MRFIIDAETIGIFKGQSVQMTEVTFDYLLSKWSRYHKT